MFDPIKSFFAPTPGDVRIRDVIRELPGAAGIVGKEIAQGTARSFDFVGRKITPWKEDTSKKNDNYFTKFFFGGNERRADTLGGVAKSEVGIDPEKHKFAAPLIGAAILGLDMTGGKGKTAGKVGEAYVNAAKGLGHMDVLKLKAFDQVASVVEKTANKNLGSLNAKDIPQEFLDGKHLIESLGLVDNEAEMSVKGLQQTARDLITAAEESGVIKQLRVSPRGPRTLATAEEHLTRYAETRMGNDYMPNINTIKAPKEVKAALKEELENSRQFFEKQAGGRMSLDAIEKAARTTTNTLHKTIGKETTEKMAAALKATRDDAVAKTEDMFRASSEGRTAAAEAAREEAMRSYLVAQSQMTHNARMLRSAALHAQPREALPLLELAKELEKRGHDIEEIIKASKGVDPKNFEQVAEFYRSFEKASAGDWLDLVRYNSMLSSPLTHAINIGSTALNAAIVRPLTKLVAGGLDFLAHPLNKAARKQFAAEVGPYAAGFVESYGKAAKKFAKVFSGKGEWTNLDLVRQLPPATKGAAGAVAKTLSFPMRVLEATDQFFMELITGAEMRALGYRARASGKEITNIAEQAQDVARYSAYRRELFNDSQNMVLDAVDKLTAIVEKARFSDNPLISWPAKLTIPFLHTPMNIVKQGIEYSPAGFATIKGSGNPTEQLAKALIGTGIGVGTVNLALSDRITFEEPTGDAQRTAWRKAGRQPMSIRIGDRWYSYEKLPPALGFPLAITAATVQRLKEQKIDESTAHAIMAGLANAQTFYSDQSYFKGIGQLIDMATGGDTYAFEKFVSNAPQQLIPFRAASGWIARMLDDTQRTIDDKATFAEKQMELLFLNIPGMREKQTEKTDSFGNPIPALNPVGNAFSPIRNVEVQKEFEAFLNDYERYAKVNRDEARRSSLMREEAMNIYNDINGKDVDTIRAELTKLNRENPDLANEVINIVEERSSGITQEESMVKNLRVRARAEFIINEIKDADQQERSQLLKRYKEVGILTKGVEDEIIKMANE